MNKLQKRALAGAILGGILWVVSGIAGFVIHMKQAEEEMMAFYPTHNGMLPVLACMLLGGLGFVAMVISLVVYITTSVAKKG
ncbi:hypothetical protein SAMN02799624_06023 [Paenibacillus sp. UNC496MF]|uniref:hypothetical protein n=1 Tax=Paenibacillus sp. UNC496MF TaxID=1502753 RepID=UPI0008F317AF|nr:hypothetical protein [Paenibacillus sp. UNC496MF]SFJ80126.1 hypothetical protein SAMN02799624_06023 [Paenibacillus sp. UNC496MF]